MHVIGKRGEKTATQKLWYKAGGEIFKLAKIAE